MRFKRKSTVRLWAVAAASLLMAAAWVIAARNRPRVTGASPAAVGEQWIRAAVASVN